MWWVLIPLVVLILVVHREDPVLRELKSRYYRFISLLPPKFDRLRRPVIITGTYSKGDIGSNVNKGGEIYVCLENSTNDAFHVLLHELAHSSVKEFDHSGAFWDAFRELKDLAVQNELYTPVGRKNYCGKVISD